MLIDWFTVAAQAINFLILVLLLRRFLYGPIVKAMDDQEAAINAQTQAAEELQTEAAAQIAAYQQKQREWQEEKAQLLRRAEEEVDARRQTLLQQARMEADEMRRRWQQTVANDSDAFIKNLRRQAGETAIQLSRRLLTDLVDISLEERMAAVFGAHLAQIPEEEWQQLLASGPLALASAWPLSPATQEAIQSVIPGRKIGEITLQFQVEPDLLYGLELRSPAYKIPWTLDNYLDEMQESFVQALDGQAARSTG